MRWLEFLKEERAKYPLDQPVYIVQDGLSSHWTQENPLVGPAEQCGAGAERHSRELDEPGRDPRAGHRGVGAAGDSLHKTTVEVGEALDAAVAYRNEERIRNGGSGSATRCGRTDGTRRGYTGLAPYYKGRSYFISTVH